MASNSEQAVSAAAAQLADFRIKNLNAGDNTPDALTAPRSTPLSTHGVIRGLPKSRYDNLVQDNPLAALKYIDEDDGEVITAGSSFELDQRLKEPFNPALAPRPPVGASSVHPDDIQLLHTFDLSSRDYQTMQLWRSLQSSRPANATVRIPPTVPIWARTKASNANDKATEGENFELDRFLHWASDLPLSASENVNLAHKWSCDKPLCSGKNFYSESDLKRHDRETHGISLEGRHAEENTLSMAIGATLIPNNIPVAADKPSADSQPRPLLELFEAELAKLLPEKESPSVPVSKNAQKATADTFDRAASQSADPDASVPLTNAAGSASPAELLTNTLSTLISGLGNFAARVDEANPQIREQLAQAHAAGQGAAFNFLSRLIPEIQSRAAAAGIRRESAPSHNALDCPNITSSPAIEAHLRTSTSPASSHHTRTYEAERILASRYICYDDLNLVGPQYRQYLVRWAGCGPADDVWYDEDNLKTSCQPLIDMYERTRNQNLTHVQEAARLHRRTAGNRMMASIVTQENPLTTSDQVARERSKSPLASRTVQFERQYTDSPMHGDLLPETTPSLKSQRSQSPFSASGAERRPDRKAYTFDPCNVLMQRAPLNFGRDSETPLRRAKSLALRNLPGISFGHGDQIDRQAPDSAATNEPSQKTFPSLRRAATTIHRHADGRSRGLEAAESLFNNFEASRGRYLPRRAATTRSAYRNEGRRGEPVPLSDKVIRCAEDLAKMGFRRSEAEPVAAVCDGDVSRALDQLEEDRKAWLWRSNNDAQNVPGDEAAGSMPGSWDIYRW